MKKKAAKRGRNRKTKYILKIGRRLLEARFKANMKKEVAKMRKKMERRTENLKIDEKNVVEAGQEDVEVKCGNVAAERRKNMC